MASEHWKTPLPKKAARPRAWVSRLEPLHDIPGEWAVVRSGLRDSTAAGYVRNLRRGAVVGVNPALYEFRPRLGGISGAEVQARYIGKPVKAVS